MKVGVLGGTFDPVHQGHIRLAQSARRQLGLKFVYFVPTKHPPLKGKVVASAHDRVAMLRRALHHLPWARLCLWEIKQPGISYTWKTLVYLHNRLGARAAIFFITGSDQASTFENWKRFERCRQLATFAVARRPGFSSQKGLKGVIRFRMRPASVSSTLIRRRIRHGRIPSGWLNPLVRRYIEQQGIYGFERRRRT